MATARTAEDGLGGEAVGDDSGAVMQLYPLGETQLSLAVVELTRPEKKNPLDWDTVKAVRALLVEAAALPDVVAVGITGRGDAFSAGGDMDKYRTLQRDYDQFYEFLTDFHDLLTTIVELAKPVIAMVNGVAVAGGFELILACDLVVAAEGARIGDAHQPYGQMGGGGVLSLLGNSIGAHRARDLVLTGRLLDAQQAADWGLVSEVVAADQLHARTVEIAARLAAYSPRGLANAKSVLNRSMLGGDDLRTRLERERAATAAYCVCYPDAAEGLEAFSERRRPQFR